MPMSSLWSMITMNSNVDDAGMDDHKADDGDDNDHHEVDDNCDDNSNTMPRSESTMSSMTKRRKYSTTSTGQISLPSSSSPSPYSSSSSPQS